MLRRVRIEFLSCVLLLSAHQAYAGKTTPPGPRIVAHIATDGALAKKITFDDTLRKRFIYVEDAQGNRTRIDVTRMDRPRVENHLPPSAAENIQIVGGSIGMTDSTTPQPPPQATPPVSLGRHFYDMSDRANPRLIQELEGATAVAIDRDRGLLYVSNNTGLWIVFDDNLIDPSVKAWNDWVEEP